MATKATLSPGPVRPGSCNLKVNDTPPVSLSPDAAPFIPLAKETELGSVSDAGVQFARCASKFRLLRSGDPASLKTELNLLFDQLISENYNNNFSPHTYIRPEVGTSHEVTVPRSIILQATVRIQINLVFLFRMFALCSFMPVV